MFTVTKEIVSGLDLFIGHHTGTIKLLTVIGSTFAVVKSIMNTWHLNQQANIQREIENNRYGLELFEKRFKVYSDLKENLKREISEDISDVISVSNKIETIRDNRELFVKCSLVFNSNDNNPIKSNIKASDKMLFLLTDLYSQYNNINALEATISDIQRNFEFSYNVMFSGIPARTKEEKDIAEKELNDERNAIKSTIAKSRKECEITSTKLADYIKYYNIRCYQCELYMQSELVVPEQAFVRKEGWYGKLKAILHNRPKHEVSVMYGSLLICLLFIFLLLCS
ncbi:hypothetical protein NKW43_15065 [Gluconobacter albidus]|uniref:hypothetical protein n=1 Tax=Gluconobacter albidus TaxID=318683 RepID=UPI0020A01052|nr:hypothetical protein [Gluconobacter albidus]MCP1274982.1 hypothetical protein [Gluconobacter albidus]